MNRILPAFRLALPALLLVLFLLPAQVARAGGYESYDPENIAEVDVLKGWWQADGSHVAALRIQLADGWKTYWRAPGEAGIPPGFDWRGSRNLQGVAFHWPVPEVFSTSGMQTIGYHDQLILPIQLFPKSAGQKITLKGQVSLGVCSDVCMPMEAEFAARLDVGEEEGEGSDLIRRALNNRPDTAREAGLGAISCDIEPISDGLRITSRLALPRVGPGEVVVMEAADPEVWVSQAIVHREGGTLVASADMVPPASGPFVLSRSDIRITVLAAGRGVDIDGCVSGS